MGNEHFFEEIKEQSLVKATIVRKYFHAWAKVIIRYAKKYNKNIGYIDLFAGRGCYEDGTASTPIQILETAIQNPDMRDMLITVFNDKDLENMRLLKTAISELPGIETLKHEPVIISEEICDKVVRDFEKINFIPTLFFVDPYGYKGLSLDLFNSILKDWGCDCIFFFNYNRISPGLNNPIVKNHMDALFGARRAEKLRNKLISIDPRERELAIIEEIAQALKEGGKYVLPFRFKNDKGNRTSHHLIFVSKHQLGYGIMKEIMAKESSPSSFMQGVPSFEYSPATSRQVLLFDLARPLEDLEEILLNDFAGRTIKMREIYETHNIDKPYVLKSYKQVLLQLEAQRKIKTNPPAEQRRKNTFGDKVEVTFPPRSG